MKPPPRFSRTVATIAAAAALSGAAPLAPEGGGRAWQYARDRSADVTHLALDLRFDDAERTVSGAAALTVTALRESTEMLEYDAAFPIESVSASRGSVRYEHAGARLRVFPDPPLDRGDTLTVTIRYHARPTRGLVFIAPDERHPDRAPQIWSQGESEENRHWFPSHDHPNEQMTVDLAATVRKPMRVVSNGRFLETADAEAGWWTWRYRESVPVPSYLVSVVIGDLEEWKQEWNGVPVLAYYPPGRRDDAERTFRRTPDMVGYFSDLFGAYPYEKLAHSTVQDFFFGGMENASAVTLNERVLMSERALADYEPAAAGLIAHEIGHMWFGDYVTCCDWAHVWINEGFSSYAEHLYQERMYGPEAFVREIRNDHDKELKADAVSPRALSTYFYGDEDNLFDDHAYSGGAAVAHMLRDLAGDEAFFAGLRLFLERHGGSCATSEDLRRALEDTSGLDLQDFFREWIYTAGHPRYEVSWSWGASDSVVVEVAQSRVSGGEADGGGPAAPLFSMPVDIDVTTAAGSARYRVLVDDAKERFAFPSADRPLAVEFDRDDWILKELAAEGDIDESLWILAKSPARASRARAARDLGAWSGARTASVVDGLAAALAEPGFVVPVEAAAALGKIGTDTALRALTANVRAEHWRTRVAVAEALGNLEEDGGARSALITMLETDESEAVAAAAATALGRVGPEADVRAPLMAAVSRRSHRERILEAAFGAFIALGSADPLDAAMHAAFTTDEGEARVVALGALGGLARSAEKERRTEVRRALEDALRDSSWRIATQAALALGDLGDDGAIPALEALAENAESRRVRRAVVRAIGTLETRKPDREAAKLRDEVRNLRKERARIDERLREAERKLERRGRR